MPQIKIHSTSADQVTQEVINKLVKLDPAFVLPTQPATRRPNDQGIESASVFTLLSRNNIVGYALLKYPYAQQACITQIYVHPACRNNQFGHRLMLELLEASAIKKCHQIEASCEKDHIPFFARFGFNVVSEPSTNARSTQNYTLENPCPDYFISTLKLAKAERKSTKNKQDGNLPIPLKLSEDTTHYRYHEKAQFMQLHRSMFSQAQRQICLISDTINSPLLSDDYLRTCFLRLAKRNPQAEIRILLEDDRTGSGYYSPIIDLAQKLTSFIEIRVIQPGATKPNEMISTVDVNGGIFRKDLNNYAGFANYNNHLIAERLRDKFDKHWQYAKPSMRLRRLSL